MKTSTFKQKQKLTTGFQLFLAFAVFGFGSLHAQVKNYGDFYINDSGAFFVKEGTFTFGSNSTTTTSRTAITFGKLIFNAALIPYERELGTRTFTDGFVNTKSTSTNYFEMPIGQTTTYAPIGITIPSVTNGVDAAYYIGALANGSTTSIAALPATGYWVIKGDSPIITMIWNSSLSTLTNSIANLTVAGYNTTTSKWEAITSGTPTGTMTAGTIATSDVVNLNSYSAFTLAKKGITCAPVFVASGLTKTWNGSQWSPSAPTETDPAVLTGTYPSTAGSFVCNSLAIGENNISLIDGQTIEVVNGISGSGVITMSSQASILQRNDASTILPTIALTKSTRNNMFPLDFVFLGSPLSSDSFSQLAGATAFNNANTAATGQAGALDEMYGYVSAVGATGGWKPLTETKKGVGFDARIKLQAPFGSVGVQNTTSHINITFTGTTNNGLIEVPVYNDLTNPDHARNHNLLANPYPSAIDADKFLEFNTNLSGVVYIWKSQTANTGSSSYQQSDYIAYTRAGSTAEVGSNTFNGKIATGQGFMVKATTASGSGNAFFNNCMRISGNNDQFMRTNNNTIVDRYKLNMTGANGIGNQILVAYMPETTLAYDRMYDAEMNSVSASQVYSILDGTNTQLAINARPAFANTDVVNIGVSKTGTALENFSIAIADKEGVFNTGGVVVYLHDSLLNVYHNLANGAYSFNSNSTELNNRFKIVYQDAALNNADFESNAVSAAINNQTLTIATSLPMTNITIYDISGRLVTEIKVDNQNSMLSEFHFSEGIYIAKIKMNNGAIATRKLINKI